MSKKFDVVIGNPPYQEDIEGTRAKQIYPYFMDSAYDIADKVTLITPGRFLFNAGATSKEWNLKMLNDVHLKVIDYLINSEKVFPHTDIMGGVTITYRDIDKIHEPIKTFVSHPTLSSILDKVEDINDKEWLDSIFFSQSSYRITDILIDDNSNHKEVKDRNSGSVVKTNIFDKLDFIFHDNKPDDENDYIRVYGRAKKEGRTYRWVRNDYIDKPLNFESWKIFLPKSNGSGAIGEVDSTSLIGQPQIGYPLEGHTETFISFGNFKLLREAEACLKYIKSKFARTMLGVLKITQDNTKRVWAKVPLQDFTEESDIDWSQSISDIDNQLYKKYGLNEEEIEFIETHVKEME